MDLDAFTSVKRDSLQNFKLKITFFLSGKSHSTRNLLESSSFYYMASHFESLKVPSSSTTPMAVLGKSCSFASFNSPFQISQDSNAD